ncbi:MAG: thioredoxin domain-containing protein [Chitinispirillaceae bacterium]|nr:thioredoxin domain-containing protein [Chitinispirillaceae bacterium]
MQCKAEPTFNCRKLFNFTIYSNIILLFFCTGHPFAQETPDLLQLYNSVISTYKIPYCCGSTIQECVEKKPDCSIARRLKTFTFWMVDHTPPPTVENMREELDNRYNGFTTTATATIDTNRLPRIGNPKVPVTLIAYASSTCPLCKRVVGELIDSVKFGCLRNKAQLLVKLFGTNFGNCALYAAQDDGNFWKLFKALKERKSVIKEEKVILAFADSLGIVTDGFKKRFKDPRTQQWLIAAKEEGSRNGVKYIPTFFINGKRYQSYKDPQWVCDAVLFELEK